MIPLLAFTVIVRRRARCGCRWLAETLDGALADASSPSPPLRPRTRTDLLHKLLRSGPVGNRRRT